MAAKQGAQPSKVQISRLAPPSQAPLSTPSLRSPSPSSSSRTVPALAFTLASPPVEPPSGLGPTVSLDLGTALRDAAAPAGAGNLGDSLGAVFTPPPLRVAAASQPSARPYVRRIGSRVAPCKPTTIQGETNSTAGSRARRRCYLTRTSSPTCIEKLHLLSLPSPPQSYE